MSNFSQEQRSGMAVTHPVVSCKRDGGDGAWPDGTVDDPWPHHDHANADNRHLRWIDHSIERLDATFAKAGDGNRRIGQLGAADASGTHSLNEVAHASHQ